MAGLFRRIPLPLWVALGFVALQVLASPGTMMSNDSYRYARSSLQILGDSREVATQKATRAWCEDQAIKADRERRIDALRFRGGPQPGLVEECVARWPTGIGPLTARYDAIFDSRIGYPLLAAPFVAVLGISDGLWVSSMLCTAVGGWLAYLLLRSAGLRRRFAVAGQVLYYVTPIGLWGSYALAEGPTLTLTMGALLGTWWMVQRRLWPGLALLAGSLLLGFVVKFSSLLLVAAALAAAATIVLWRDRATRGRGTYLLIAVNVAWVVAASALAAAWRWPGVSESLQDTFTRRFYRPDVPDPWQRLLELNVNYWIQWVQTQARAPVLVVALVVAAWALFRRNATLGWLVTAVALTGPATVAAHPFLGQEERLMVAVWILPVVGLPMLLAGLADRAGDRVADRAGDPAGGRPGTEPQDQPQDEPDDTVRVNVGGGR